MAKPKRIKIPLFNDVSKENINFNVTHPIAIFKMNNLMSLIYKLLILSFLLIFSLGIIGINMYLLVVFITLFIVLVYQMIKDIFYLMGYFLRVNFKKGGTSKTGSTN